MTPLQMIRSTLNQPLRNVWMSRKTLDCDNIDDLLLRGPYLIHYRPIDERNLIRLNSCTPRTDLERQILRRAKRPSSQPIMRFLCLPGAFGSIEVSFGVPIVLMSTN
jgi:hypothetical protein